MKPSEAGAAMVAPVILFDYFGVLAHRYGQPDKEMMGFIQQHLAGRYRLAVLSNMNGGSAEEMLGEYSGLFEKVIISGDLGVAKPDPRAFLMAARQLREFAESCVMVDDSELNCSAAKGVGMQAIYYQNLGQFEQKLREYGILTP